MQQTSFSIADLAFSLSANFDITDSFLTPQPFNIHHNFLIRTLDPSRNATQYITLHHDTKPLRIKHSMHTLGVSGNLKEPDGSTNIDRQIGLFGNNGLINKYILHSLESTNQSVTFHACAVQDPSSKKVYMAFGASGSGKSVIVLSALKAGWQIIATEYVTIDINLVLHAGNYLDNVSSKAIDDFKKNVPNAKINSEKNLKNMFFHKVFVDLSAHAIVEPTIDLNRVDLSIIVLAGSASEHRHGTDITDERLFRRTLQENASEKIMMPLIVNGRIIETDLNGTADVRNEVVEALCKQAKNWLALGGSIQDFDDWLLKQ